MSTKTIVYTFLFICVFLMIYNFFFCLQYVSTHLNFLQYILQVGIQCLTWNRAREIWSTLVANQEACDWDKEVLFSIYSKKEFKIYCKE